MREQINMKQQNIDIWCETISYSL